MKWGLMVLILAFKGVAGQFYFYDNKYFDHPFIIDLGLSIGAMNCLTDLGAGNRNRKGLNLEWQNFRPQLGMEAGVTWNRRYGFLLQLNYGTITASDSVLKSTGGDAIYRYQRNLHVRSRIFEALFCGAIYPTGFVETERFSRFAPYVFAGIGIFHFNPQAYLLQSWTSLPPLRSEGNEPATFYNCWQLNFPVGVGINYEINARFSLLFEGNYRVLRTDYLDDVSTTFIDPAQQRRTGKQAEQLKALYALSQIRGGPDVSLPGAIRGNPGNKDSYFSFRTAVCWVLNRQRIH